MDAVGERGGTRRLDRAQAVAQHRGEDFDHLPVAVIRALEAAAVLNADESHSKVSVRGSGR